MTKERPAADPSSRDVSSIHTDFQVSSPTDRPETGNQQKAKHEL